MHYAYLPYPDLIAKLSIADSDRDKDPTIEADNTYTPTSFSSSSLSTASTISSNILTSYSY